MKDKDAAALEKLRKPLPIGRTALKEKQPRKSTAEQLAVLMAQYWRDGNKQMVLDMLTHGRHATVYLSAKIALELYTSQDCGEFLRSLEHALDLGKGQR